MTRAKKSTRALTPEQAAKAFAAFAAAGYPAAKFTEPLYRVLMHAFGFIAHYDRNRFFAVRFADLGGRVETLQTMVAPTPWGRRPMEVALHEAVLGRGLLDAAVLERDAQVEAAERAELARLKDKYEEVDPLT
jgi:hypothetical protein